MLPFQDALNLCLARARTLPAEKIPLDEALGRVLAEPVRSDIDFPPFDKSAMDGFACRRRDLESSMRVIETVAAGRVPERSIGSGECARIMTGAPVPAGADCVVMVEHTATLPDGHIRALKVQSENNICRRGEDLRAGDEVLPRGTLVNAAVVATLSGVGCTLPIVCRRPVVTVLATGSELVAPTDAPQGAQIRDSNSHQLLAQLRGLGIAAHGGGIVADTLEDTLSAIRKARETSDVILLSGGVSLGDFDFVPIGLRESGFRTHFESVAMQPGRPTHFAETDDGIFCFGLPGNPVSTFVVFELLVKPFLLKMMGCRKEPLFVRGPLSQSIRRKPTARQSSYPIRIRDDGTFEPLEYHGAAHVHALTRAHALLTLPPQSTGVEAGETVSVRLLFS